MKKKTIKKILWLSSCIGVLIFFLCFFIWQNNSIEVTQIRFEHDKIPVTFDDFKIVQISDLHNKEFGENQRYIIQKIQALKPNVIVITGDIIDRRKFNLGIALNFIHQATKIAPVYYVSGNHEAWSGKYDVIIEKLKASGVTVLENQRVTLTKGNQSIQLYGLADPALLESNTYKDNEVSDVHKILQEWGPDKSFKILLSHRPELFALYCENQMDLVFSGHAHGGQIRLPFIGGLFAPNQGFLPKYTSGAYQNENTTMIVSRGLGNSIFPLRVLNRPEIIAVTLKAT